MPQPKPHRRHGNGRHRMAASSTTPAADLTSLSQPLAKLLGYICKYRHTELQKLCTQGGGDEFAEFNVPYHITKDAWHGCYAEGPRCGATMVTNIHTMFAHYQPTTTNLTVPPVDVVVTSTKRSTRRRRSKKSKAANNDDVSTNDAQPPNVTIKGKEAIQKEEDPQPSPYKSSRNQHRNTNKIKQPTSSINTAIASTSLSPTKEDVDTTAFCPIPAPLIWAIDKRRGPWLGALCIAGGAPQFTSLNKEYGIEEKDWWLCYSDSLPRKGTLSNIKSMFSDAHAKKQQRAADNYPNNYVLKPSTPVYIKGKEFIELIHYCWVLSTCDAATVKIICEHRGTIDQGLAWCIVPDEEWTVVNDVVSGGGTSHEVMVAMQEMFRSALRNGTLKRRVPVGAVDTTSASA